jgi:antirestriction protein ArdC
MSNVSVYETVTNQILAELEQGTVPWVKPWTTRLPYNAVSQREYHGVNILPLLTTAMHRGYRHPAWLTFHQAKELRGSVKKGEHGTPIVYAASYTKRQGSEDEEDDTTVHFLKFYTVFNVEQTSGLPAHCYASAAPPPLAEALVDAAAFVAKSGATVIHGGSKACYLPESDEIHLPVMADFESEAHYFATRLHEEGHWTGHPTRLHRDLSGRFGDRAYAAEELVAEFTAAFLCTFLAIPGRLQHAEYIGHWITLLKEDKRAIFTAASQASKAADYLRERSATMRTEAGAHP